MAKIISKHEEEILGAFEDFLLDARCQLKTDNDCIIIPRKYLLDEISYVTNLNNTNLWKVIKKLSGWKNSKTELKDGSLKFKIKY